MVKPLRLRVAAFVAVVATLTLSVPTQENWMQFRGPGAMGVADDPRLPDSWSATENVAWSTDIPGRGWSSPIVVGDSIILTSVASAVPEEAPRRGLYFGGDRPDPPKAEHRWIVLALDWDTGDVQWRKDVASAVPGFARHLKNTFASETPVSDGERIYAYFGNVGLFCLDPAGEILWTRNWDPVKTRFGWGTAASPVLHEDRIYIVNDNDEQSFLCAIDKKTGEDVWRVDREEGSNWATPFIWQNRQRTEIVTPGTDRVRSYDLDGKLLWEFGGMSSISIPTPFAKFGLLYVASGYVGDRRRPVFAVRPGASGDISLGEGEASNDHIAWFHPQAGPYNPSPIVHGDNYYTLLDRGIFTAHDARTGEVVYDRQRVGRATAFTASPWAYNDKIFALSEDGDTYVIRAGSEFEILGTNSLEEFSMSTPAIARGSLIIRTQSKLYRITNSGK